MDIHQAAGAKSLSRLPKFGSGVGLCRCQRLFGQLYAMPECARLDTIRVTGSNGKGSVTALVHAMLTALGLRVGRFTSPHLLRFNERIVLGSGEITDAELDEGYAWFERESARVVADFPGERFAAFEASTAIAFRSFLRDRLEVAVVEAGIGGRYDTTRLLPGTLTAVTSIDLEHTELLGGTRELIAYDKMDLCPEGGTIVVACADPILLEKMNCYAGLRKIAFINALGRCHILASGIRKKDGTWRQKVELTYDGYPIEIMSPLIGDFQEDNIATAVCLVAAWLQKRGQSLSRERFAAIVSEGIAAVRWPGRLERISQDPEIYIDIGHTPDACRRVAHSFKQIAGTRPIGLVLGVSADKAKQAIVSTLCPIADEIICTRAYHKGEQVAAIVDMVRQAGFSGSVTVCETIESAVAQVKQRAADTQPITLVVGGLFLATEFHVAWRGGSPQELAFL